MNDPTRDDIVTWLRLGVQPGMVIELRILGAVDNPRYPAFTVSGYFDFDHLAELARIAMEWTGKAEGCYITINPVRPDLLARAANRVAKRPKHTTTDAEVERRFGLVFDADPKRPAGVSATATEKAEARDRIERLVHDLSGRGWPVPILADSGNGFHARYRIDLANNDGALELVERVLKAADALYSDDKVAIDSALSNASRIIKLYGTKARKGDDIFARPHRWSRVLSAPDPADIQVVPTELLEALAALYQPAPPPEANTKNPSRHGSFKATARDGAGIAYPKPGVSVFDDYDQKTSWGDLLHDWTEDQEFPNGEIRLTRPGKNGGTSATIGYKGKDILHVFTSNAEPFEAGKSYTKFQVYALAQPRRGREGRRRSTLKSWLRELAG
jgi:hypothetical protein